MENIPGGSYEDDAEDQSKNQERNQDDSNQKKRRKGGAGLSLLLKLQHEQAEKSQDKPLGPRKTLGEALVQLSDNNAEKPKPDATENAGGAETAGGTETAEQPAVPQPEDVTSWAEHAHEPNEHMLGVETIYDLSGVPQGDNRTVEERVMFSREEADLVATADYGPPAASEPVVPETPVWGMQQQPEQQHQARDEAEPAPGPIAASGNMPPTGPPEGPLPFGTGGPTPEQSAPAYQPAESGSFNPAESYRLYMQQKLQTEQLATRAEVDKAMRSAKAPAFFALLLGGYNFLKGRQLNHKVEKVSKDNKATAKKLNEARAHYEAQTRVAQEAAAAAQARPETPPENLVVQHGVYAAEINRRTGHLAETQTLTHGEEFYKELAKERGQATQQSTTAGQAAILGAAGGGAAGPGGGGGTAGSAADTGMPSDDATQQAAQVPDASTRRSTLRSSQGDDSSALTGRDDETPSQAGPIWPWLVALLVVIISLVIVLR